jgi:hypothetical protein
MYAEDFREYIIPGKFKGFKQKFNLIMNVSKETFKTDEIGLAPIEREICDVLTNHGLPWSETTANVRFQHVCTGRKIFFFVSRYGAGSGLVRTGKLVGRHYSTVLHGLKKFNHSYATDRGFAKQVVNMIMEIKSNHNLLQRLREIEVFYTKRVDSDEYLMEVGLIKKD